jgi:hypothetical protein
MTISGCPLLWPICWRGRRWHQVAPHRRLRLRTGSAVEMALLLPLLSTAGLAAGWWAMTGLASR